MQSSVGFSSSLVYFVKTTSIWRIFCLCRAVISRNKSSICVLLSARHSWDVLLCRLGADVYRATPFISVAANVVIMIVIVTAIALGVDGT